MRTSHGCPDLAQTHALLQYDQYLHKLADYYTCKEET
jgi:hypothetical protein